jgi:hypothetical protein
VGWQGHPHPCLQLLLLRRLVKEPNLLSLLLLLLLLLKGRLHKLVLHPCVLHMHLQQYLLSLVHQCLAAAAAAADPAPRQEAHHHHHHHHHPQQHWLVGEALHQLACLVAPPSAGGCGPAQTVLHRLPSPADQRGPAQEKTWTS